MFIKFLYLNIFFLLFNLNISSLIDSNDITIIGTVGGYLHAINSHTLQKKWSVNIGGPLITANEGILKRDYTMIPMIDGSLLYHGVKGIFLFFINLTLLT